MCSMDTAASAQARVQPAAPKPPCRDRSSLRRPLDRNRAASSPPASAARPQQRSTARFSFSPLARSALFLWDHSPVQLSPRNLHSSCKNPWSLSTIGCAACLCRPLPCLGSLPGSPARFPRLDRHASRRQLVAKDTSCARQDDYLFRVALEGSSLITKSIPLSFPRIVSSPKPIAEVRRNRRIICKNSELACEL
jgi:hypothetical protein